MAQRRVNYGSMYRKNQADEPKPEDLEAPVPETEAEPVVAEEERPVAYLKTVTSKIRIRKGPGPDFDHNGEYVSDSKVMIVRVENNFGLLEDYKEGSDGWVSLKFFKRAR